MTIRTHRLCGECNCQEDQIAYYLSPPSFLSVIACGEDRTVVAVAVAGARQTVSLFMFTTFVQRLTTSSYNKHTRITNYKYIHKPSTVRERTHKIRFPPRNNDLLACSPMPSPPPTPPPQHIHFFVVRVQCLYTASAPPSACLRVDLL